MVIKVDTEDSAEAKFISMLDIQQEITDSYIVAINGQGMMTGRFEKLPTVEELVDAAMMTVQSSCASGGCGPSCH